MLRAVCTQAMGFATEELRSWEEAERHARTLAPMMGIAPSSFDRATRLSGRAKATSAVFILLEMGQRVRNVAAYFASLTTGNRRNQFDPAALLQRFARSEPVA